MKPMEKFLEESQHLTFVVSGLAYTLMDRLDSSNH